MIRAKEGGVEKTILSITDPSEYGRAKEILDTYLGIYLTVCFGPITLSYEKFDQFNKNISSATMVGIGEVGFDHFYMRSSGELNRKKSSDPICSILVSKWH